MYRQAELEDLLGSDAYLDLISIDYRDPHAVKHLKAHLVVTLLPPPCQCHTLPDRGSVGMGEWRLTTFETVEHEADGIPWLHRLRCNDCNTAWLVAAEELINDVWLVSRQDGTDWPEVRTYQGLLVTALSMGAGVRYLDPFRSMELPKAMRALASEAPGIALTDVVEVLPVDRSMARVIAEGLMADQDVQIDLER